MIFEDIFQRHLQLIETLAKFAKKACQRSPFGAKMWNSHTSIHILRDILIEIEIVRNNKRTLRNKSATNDDYCLRLIECHKQIPSYLFLHLGSEYFSLIDSVALSFLFVLLLCLRLLSVFI